jgi:hypothetical protein
MLAPRAAELLSEVPLTKVTVAKEVLRLLGELPSGIAVPKLCELDRKSLHRDVRVALLRALWEHLEAKQSWEILERAAQDSDAALATGLLRIPADRLSPESQRRLLALFTQLLAHPQPEVRLAVHQRCAALPIADPERLLLQRLLDRLRGAIGDERRALAKTVIAGCTARDAALLGGACAALLADAEHGPRSRRALLALLDELVSVLSTARSRLLEVARAVTAPLLLDDAALSQGLRLAVSALRGAELFGVLREAESRLQGDALFYTQQALEQAGELWNLDELGWLERELSRSPHPRLRRLGLAALVGLSQRPPGFDAGRLAALRAYREDPAPIVAAAARFTLPKEEEAAADDGPTT